jgi:hypothetical protein
MTETIVWARRRRSAFGVGILALFVTMLLWPVEGHAGKRVTASVLTTVSASPTPFYGGTGSTTFS